MQRLFSVLALSCVTFTGCQNLSIPQPPCSCGHQHAAVLRHPPIVVSAPTEQQSTRLARAASAAHHGSSHQCKHAHSGHVVAAQSIGTPHRVEPKPAHAHCKNCRNHKKARMQYVVQPILVQAPRPLARHIARSGTPKTMPAPIPASAFQLKPVPQMSAARTHLVAADEPMVSLPGMKHDQYVQLASYQSNVMANQNQWKAR